MMSTPLTFPLWTRFEGAVGSSGFKPSRDPIPSFLTKARCGPGHATAVNSETLLCGCGSPATSYCAEQQSQPGLWSDPVRACRESGQEALCHRPSHTRQPLLPWSPWHPTHHSPSSAASETWGGGARRSYGPVRNLWGPALSGPAATESHGVEKVTDTGAGPTPRYWLVTVGGGKGVESRPPPRKPQVSVMGRGRGRGLASLLCFPPNPHLTNSFSWEFPRLCCHTSSSSAISLQVPVARSPGPSRSSVSISAELCTPVSL